MLPRQMPRILACLCLTGLAALSSAQAQSDRPRISLSAVLDRDDSDSDGAVTATEFSGPKALFRRLDTNGDDKIDKADFADSHSGASARGRRQIPGTRLVKDVVFGQGGGRDLKLHLVLPDPPADAPTPLIVWIHGGGWMGGNKEGGVGRLSRWVKEGFAGATIEYRLTGEAAFPAQIHDCKCAIRFLRAHADKYNLDPSRIAVAGSSAGGHLVALLGTSRGADNLEGDGGWNDQRSDVQAVIDLYGPTDFQIFVTTPGYESHNRDQSPESRLLGGGIVTENPEGIRRVNPITYIDPKDPPFLIIHGSADRVVPANQSEALHAALKKAGVKSKLHIIAGAGHGGAGFGEPKIQEMQMQFLRDTLLKTQHADDTPADSDAVDVDSPSKDR
ncbi:alpha/beta hydrolase [Crateriforma conspicua]|uniref:alpha/beta hydrolase n=1 Tax=Crateriforma conspicua TaxID=2527996 RepID=UPI001187E339|nr:alpha/beta hydrolase [Crateriforma conspicua]QDV62094.1 Carboxylesterase NlhH [Crateriforma conspicua]